MLQNNDAFIEVFHSKVHDVRFYQPKDIANGYHTSRYVAAMTQNIYSSSGTTKEYLEALTDAMSGIVNSGNKNNIITDVAVLVNNLKYRLKYPVDEDCAIRMGAIYAIAEDEEPNEVHPHWLKKKMDMCKGAQGVNADPEMYSFFLTTGASYTPAWKERLQDLGQMSDYFNGRNETLRSLSLNR